MTIPVMTRRNVRFASFSRALRSISDGSSIARMFQHDARNRIAAMSKAAINPSHRLPSNAPAGTAPITRAARNMMNRHGATMLPMLRPFAMTIEA